jgi:hypothetical protein
VRLFFAQIVCYGPASYTQRHRKYLVVGHLLAHSTQRVPRIQDVNDHITAIQHLVQLSVNSSRGALGIYRFLVHPMRIRILLDVCLDIGDSSENRKLSSFGGAFWGSVGGN